MTTDADRWTHLAMSALELGDELLAGSTLTDEERKTVERLQQQTRQSVLNIYLRVARLAIAVAETEDSV